MIFFLLNLLLSTTSLHPYYVSVFEVEHNSDTKTFQVAARIFIEDLEKVLIDEGFEDPKIGTAKEHPDANSMVATYLNRHFSLTANGEPLALNLIGKETDNDVVWCYLESPEIEHIDTLNVHADLLINLFPTQTNIVHFKIWGTKTSTILRKGRTDKQLLYSEFH